MSDIHSTPNKPPEPSQFEPELLFKNVTVALRELRKLQPPLTEELRESFLRRVKQSRFAKPIAFSLLALGWSEKVDARVAFVRNDMRSVLLGDVEFPEEKHLADARIRRAWLEKEFDVEHRSTAAKAYLVEFSYLRPLYIILVSGSLFSVQP